MVKLRANNLQTLNVFWTRCSVLIRRSQRRQQQWQQLTRGVACTLLLSPAPPPPRWAWHIRSHSARLGENENYLKTVFNLPVNLIAPGTALRWPEGVEQMALGRPYFAFLVPPRCFCDYYVPILALPLALQSDASLNSLFRFVL